MSITLASCEVSRMKKRVDLLEKSEEYKKLRDDMLRSQNPLIYANECLKPSHLT
jgi:hypothetical protein